MKNDSGDESDHGEYPRGAFRVLTTVKILLSSKYTFYFEPTGNTVGLDIGLKEYYTDSDGVMVENPKFLRKGEKVLKRSQRRVSRRLKGSKNRGRARQILGKRYLKISRQRKDHAVKLARCVVQSNDLIAYVSEAGRV